MDVQAEVRGGRAGSQAPPAVLRTEGLTKHYGPVVALEDLSLELQAGEVLGYLGPNGAGKTTTIRLLLGLIRPTRGRAEIFGLDVQDEKVAVHAGRVRAGRGGPVAVAHRRRSCAAFARCAW